MRTFWIFPWSAAHCTPPKTPQVRVVLLICMQIHLYVDVDYFMKIGLFFGGFFAGRIFFFTAFTQKLMVKAPGLELDEVMI